MKLKNTIPMNNDPDHLDSTKYEIVKHGTVWDHTLSALRTYEGNNPIVNMAILFHDVGKPPKHFVDEDGKHRFFKHERNGFHMIDDIAKRMKLDNKTRDAIKFATLNHMKFHLLTKMTSKKVVALMNDPNWDVLFKVAEADDRSRLHAFDEESWNRKLEKIERLTKQFLRGEGEETLLHKIKRTINGKLVMELLGIKTGPKIGKVIKKTIGWIVDNEIDINDIEKIKEFIISQK